MLDRHGENDRHKEEECKTYEVGFGAISGRVYWVPAMVSVLDSMPQERLEEAPEYEVQAMGLLLCNLGYYCTLSFCQLFSGLDPRTWCLFPLATVALVPVEFCTYSLLRRQTWASTEGNPFPTAFMPITGGKSWTFIPTILCPMLALPKKSEWGQPSQIFYYSITVFGCCLK